MRYPHILRHNKTSETPSRVAVLKLHTYVSAENDIDKTVSWDFGYLSFCRLDSGQNAWCKQTKRVQTNDEIFFEIEKWTTSKKKTYLMLESTYPTITLINLFSNLTNRSWICTLAVIERKPLLIRFRREQRSLLVFGASNILQTPSCPCCTTEPHVQLQPNGYVPSDHLECDVHIRSDCTEMTRQITEWIDFIRVNDLGGFSPTIGSQAMRVFRHRYMHHEILIDNNESALKLARSAYKGARTEAFRHGRLEGKYWMLDTTCMYGSIMHDMWVPVRLRGQTRYATVENLRAWSDNSVCIALCMVSTDVSMFAVRSDNGLVFRSGVFDVTLAGEEILRALRGNFIKEVHEVGIYERAIAFRPFIDAMWGRRLNALKKADASDAERYKSLINAFNGKWGQSGRRWEKIEDVDSDEVKTWLSFDFQTKKIVECRQFARIVQECVREPESRDSMPAIAACITAAGRMRLLDLMCTAGLENVVYVDTDAVMVCKAGFDRLVHLIEPHKLGGLHVVWESDSVEIIGKKNYRYGNEWRHAGMPAMGTWLDCRHTLEDQNRSLFRSSAEMDAGTAKVEKIKKTWKAKA